MTAPIVDRALFPFEGKFFFRNGLRQHYLDEGHGDPIVMLHGNPSWSFYYRNLTLALREQYRVIVPDHIGMGLSDKPGDSAYDYRLKSRVDDLDALIDSLKLNRPITLVMHDWGGMIGMAYAQRTPACIARLVLFNTAAFHLPAPMRLPRALALIRNTSLGSLLVRGGNVFAKGAAQVGCKRRPLSQVLRRAYCAPYDSWANRIATLRFVQDIPMVPTDPSYDLVSKVQAGLSQFQSTPAMFCWGDRDFVFTPAVLDVWRTYWPQAQVHQFADCGHYVLEDAASEITTLVQDFLKAHPV